MSENVTPADGLTRRELLKRAATVGAAAWTVPIVSTFNAPAFAQETVSPASCPSWDCGDPQDICGVNAPGSPSPNCFCDIDTEGNAFCWNDIFCSDSPSCTTSADCPDGWRCTTNCCGLTCLPPCGTAPAVKQGLDRQDLRSAGGQ